MSRKDEYENTKHNSVWKRLHKYYARVCTLCPWHKVENKTHKDERNWKRTRKTKYKQED